MKKAIFSFILMCALGVAANAQWIVASQALDDDILSFAVISDTHVDNSTVYLSRVTMWNKSLTADEVSALGGAK